MTAEPHLSVLIPAHDEADWIARCLSAVFASRGALPAMREVLVIANACRDDTVAQARGMEGTARQAGWDLRVIETPVPGKLPALSLGDAEARGDLRIYLDADVLVDPDLVAELVAALSTQVPRYATGRARIARADSAASRAYARFWMRLPFVVSGTPGFGCFALNGPGRARWGIWPDIIADDMFARLSFAPDERIGVQAGYVWPPVEGFANLVRVRRRQNAGVSELTRLYPRLGRNEDKAGLSLARQRKPTAQQPRLQYARPQDRKNYP
jgi:glycosyltransferase involved in cell wall biosynthesis